MPTPTPRMRWGSDPSASCAQYRGRRPNTARRYRSGRYGRRVRALSQQGDGAPTPRRHDYATRPTCPRRYPAPRRLGLWLSVAVRAQKTGHPRKGVLLIAVLLTNPTGARLWFRSECQAHWQWACRLIVAKLRPVCKFPLGRHRHPGMGSTSSSAFLSLSFDLVSYTSPTHPHRRPQTARSHREQRVVERITRRRNPDSHRP